MKKNPTPLELLARERRAALAAAVYVHERGQTAEQAIEHALMVADRIWARA